MTWAELVAAAERLGAQPDDEIWVEYPNYDAITTRTDELCPRGVKCEFGDLTLTLDKVETE